MARPKGAKNKKKKEGLVYNLTKEEKRRMTEWLRRRGFGCDYRLNEKKGVL